MLSKNAFTYTATVDIQVIVYWDIIKYPDYKRCPDFRVSTYTCTCFQFSIHVYCAEGLHFSVLVSNGDSYLPCAHQPVS